MNISVKQLSILAGIFLCHHLILRGQVVFKQSDCSREIQYGRIQVERALVHRGYTIHRAEDFPIRKKEYTEIQILTDFSEQDKIKPEGYHLKKDRGDIIIHSVDAKGAMYALLELADQIINNEVPLNIREKSENPFNEVRAIKFNLPWSVYRPGESNLQHAALCRDLDFWEEFLDMMATNRFNMLSLWNLHPFPYMIRSTNFPEACPFTDEEMTEWKRFWESLFKMAADRGIESFIVNWNIVVSGGFARTYIVEERNDTSEITRRYTRESVTQVINEYKDLTGVGVSLADWMRKMSPEEKEEWVDETFIEGIKQAERPVKFIHRSVLAGSSDEMRRILDKANLPEKTLVEVKFNWSHGHSTPRLAITHASRTGEINTGYWDPFPENYRIQWMVRNEDFFILRWGEPDFIRNHIHLNHKPFSNGYFIGSEGHIPALEYAQKFSVKKNWQFSFQRQWLFYSMWGRLLYNPDTPNEVFEEMLNRRFGNDIGKAMLEAYALGSRMPLRLASFHAAAHDLTLYSEGFLVPAQAPKGGKGLHDGLSAFISIDEFINHEVLDPYMLNIPDFVKLQMEGKTAADSLITPMELAALSEEDSHRVLMLVDSLRNFDNQYLPAFELELDDLETWGYMGLYLASKLRAGIELELFRKSGGEDHKERSVNMLEQGLSQWKKVSEITSGNYRPILHLSSKEYNWLKLHPGEDYFSWEKYIPQVEKDIQIARQSKTLITAY